MSTLPVCPWASRVVRCIAAFSVTGLMAALTSCSSQVAATAVIPANSPAATNQWVVAWGASPENATTSTNDPGGSERSFRFLLLPTIDGTQERVHFSNRLGTTPITIGAARLAVATGTGAAVDGTKDVPLTFGGATSVTMAAGQDVVSDPVNLTYTYGQKLAVSMYLPGNFPALTVHDSQVTTDYEGPIGGGNTTTDTAGTTLTDEMTQWFLVSGVDVYGLYQGTVAIFGSSSVDGHNSNFGNTNSYPTANVAVAGQDNDRPSDWLAREMLADGYRVGVLNAGALADPAGEDSGTAAGNSIAGVDRMQKDVLQQAGIKAVVIYFGGIDLRNDCRPATDLEASLTNMVAQAQAAGVRVILATLPPSEYCTTSTADLLPSTANPYQGDLNPGPENTGSAARRAVNTWIRTIGPTLPGVVSIADFDSVLADTTHPDFMIPNLNSGDNFHPNGAGYGIQSAAISRPTVLGTK